MPKTTQKDFTYFKACCQKWIDRFQLNGWQVNYKLIKLNGNQATFNSQYRGCRASISLDIELDPADGETINEMLEGDAQHEVIHLLLCNFSMLASSRFVTEDEIVKAEEELVRKLQGIIKG